MLTPKWVTATGDEIPVSLMTSAHIRAVLRYLCTGDGDHGPMNRPGCAGYTNGEWRLLCASELTRRAS
jgi:hypothetical protein